ncbi:MAG: hypothetical protein IJ809_06400 [Clostridia bacterium]|nr:hypothetical protein [Clostridia bacterium]
MSLTAVAKETIAKELGIPTCEIWNLDSGIAVLRLHSNLECVKENKDVLKVNSIKQYLIVKNAT